MRCRLATTRYQLLFTAVALLAWLLSPIATVSQTATPPPAYTKTVAAVIKNMTVNQKVGQLFVVSFPGTETAPTSDIADLIINYRVGGVLLKAANQNITNGPEGPRQLAELSNRLQMLAATTGTLPISSSVVTPALASPVKPLPAGVDFIPMFVTLAQEGDGAPNSELTEGVTPIPSQLAVGATWRPEYAGVVGQIVGKELSEVGVNVLLGPVLDVLDSPKASTPLDAGTRVFGGDPYWVGKFGASYISGVHAGARNRIAVISSRFPGLGSSDRSVDDEIPTVQKSLEQLKQIELAPFFAVTQLADGQPVSATTDGLLMSHIRYRGFQGNIRASTRPVSLDPQAYQALMSLPEIAPWRAAGGITFSDMLGARGVRRFYDPLDTTFNARRVAQEAFTAGNDVLVLGNFGLTNSWPEQLANIKDTIQFFRERYVSDQTFAARVDAALARILALKLKLYQGSLTAGNVLVDPVLAGQIQPSAEIIGSIAKDGVTLLSPSARDLPALVPAAPGKDESIVFITDDRQIKECVRCNSYPAIPRTALQDIALNLYGPKTTGQLNPSRVSSFTFSDLADYTTRAAPPPSVTLVTTATTATDTLVTPSASATATLAFTPTIESPRVQSAIDNADLIVIAMLDFNPAAKSPRIFRDFLAQRADALRDKRVVVFAFGAPYYLDTTEISKLTAYFGVYSRMPPYLEAAVRALFGEFAPAGASPVSISVLNYSLLTQTAPDPNQIIPLSAGDPMSTTQASEGSLEMKLGDKLRLRAGPVYDRNGHLVPDGTQIQFVLAYPTERVEQQQPAVSTRDGVAETTVLIERKGTMEIRAVADPALTSYVVRVNIGDNAASIETIRPTAQPTHTPEPTATATDKPTTAPTIEPTPPAAVQTQPPVIRSSLGGFVVTLLALVVIALAAILTLNGSRRVSPSMRWRVVLLSWSSGWIAYVLYATGVPGMAEMAGVLGWYGSVLLATIIALIVLLIGLVVVMRAEEQPANPIGGH
jgi:beta-N-acetylhexosaminidase